MPFEDKSDSPLPLGHRLIWTAFLVICTALALRFNYQAVHYGRTLEAVAVSLIAFVYITSLLYKGRRGAHPLKSPGPWIVFLMLGGLPMGFTHRAEVPSFDSVQSEKTWLDQPFTIHGVHPGMSRDEVTKKLGTPTGHEWVYQTELKHFNAGSTERLLHSVITDLESKTPKAWLYEEHRGNLQGWLARSKERLSKKQYGPFDTRVNEEELSEAFAVPELFVVLWPAESSFDELHEKLTKMLEDSKRQEHTILLVWPHKKPLYSGRQKFFSTLIKTRRWKLHTFEQPGVALDYVPMSTTATADGNFEQAEGDEVDSVHGDALSFGDKVFVRAGETTPRFPPDWPSAKRSSMQLFSTHPAELLEVCVLLDLRVSDNQIQVQLLDDKVRKVAIFNLRYNK